MAAKKTLKICKKGHHYQKSTDCPTCPICEEEKKPKIGPFSKLPAPALRALQNNGVTTLKQLAKLTEQDILKFHGMGKASLPIFKAELKKAGLSFKK